jgi:hypothetical protein
VGGLGEAFEYYPALIPVLPRFGPLCDVQTCLIALRQKTVKKNPVKITNSEEEPFFKIHFKLFKATF